MLKLFNSRHIKLELLTRESVDDDACMLCFDSKASVVIKPCGHTGLCGGCAAQLTICPICRAEIKSTVEGYEDMGEKE